MKTTEKRILDYGYYCDIVELNTGNLRIDINEERKIRLKEIVEAFENANELDVFPEMLSSFGEYIEFIPDVGNDGRFAALTSSCGIYEPESKRLWWYPNYQIHNLFERLMEDKEIVFELAENS